MPDAKQHATHPGAAKDHDPDQQPGLGRRRGDPASPGEGVVNPTPPQRGGGEPQEYERGGVRGDPAQPGGGDVNPLPPQRGYGDGGKS